jgi:hypothetical protein
MIRPASFQAGASAQQSLQLWSWSWSAWPWSSALGRHRRRPPRRSSSAPGATTRRRSEQPAGARAPANNRRRDKGEIDDQSACRAEPAAGQPAHHPTASAGRPGAAVTRCPPTAAAGTAVGSCLVANVTADRLASSQLGSQRRLIGGSDHSWPIRRASRNWTTWSATWARWPTPTAAAMSLACGWLPRILPGPVHRCCNRSIRILGLAAVTQRCSRPWASLWFRPATTTTCWSAWVLLAGRPAPRRSMAPRVAWPRAWSSCWGRTRAGSAGCCPRRWRLPSSMAAYAATSPNSSGTHPAKTSDHDESMRVGWRRRPHG